MCVWRSEQKIKQGNGIENNGSSSSSRPERGRNYQKCKKPAASEEKEEEACHETILLHRKLLELYHRSRTAKSKKGAAISVTRLGDFLDFWPLFKAFGSN